MILTKIMIRHSHSKMSIQRIKRGCWNIIIIMYRKTVTFWEMLAMNTDVWRVLGNYKYILKLRKSLLFRLYLNIKNQFIIQWKRETQEQDICFNRGGKIIICLPSVQYAPTNPSVHEHVKHSSFCVKVPPFWHGLSRHWFLSKNIKR